MKQMGRKKQAGKGYAELVEDDYDYEKHGAEVTVDGKYRCRYCGAVFETLEKHDEHHRRTHSKSEAYLALEN